MATGQNHWGGTDVVRGGLNNGPSDPHADFPRCNCRGDLTYSAAPLMRNGAIEGKRCSLHSLPRGSILIAIEDPVREVVGERLCFRQHLCSWRWTLGGGSIDAKR